MTTTKARKPAPPSQSPPRSLETGLHHYQQTLDALLADATALLPALLARDEVEQLRTTTPSLAVEQVKRLFALDARLRHYADTHPLPDLPHWRQSLSPSATAWWWQLDQPTAQRTEKELPWLVLTGVLVALTIHFALDIIQRLWNGAPPTAALFGTSLTVLLTGSPLLQQGQDLVRWLLKRLPQLPARLQVHVMAVTAFLAFLLVLIGQFVLLPSLALYYNNQGAAALQQGNLTAAQHFYQRAVALAPDRVVPYYSLAETYFQIGRLDDARHWYQQAIDHNKNFASAYRGLGHLYNLQGEPTKAEHILVAALDLPTLSTSVSDSTLITFTRYTLLADLGWAYFAQQRFDLAQAALEESLALEQPLELADQQAQVEYRIALPHIYLAQIYEQLDRPQDAAAHWQAALRLLDPTTWQDCAHILLARKHLQPMSSDLHCQN